ncbi:MAG: dihydroxy-acid dehydratase [Chloroflexota bacterium]
MRSDITKQGKERSPHRSLLRAVGVDDYEMEQPFIGVVNSFSEIVPGHVHLRSIADAVKAGIRSAGGTPFEFNTIAACDGVAQAHSGMCYILPTREVIADSVELMQGAQQFDGLVFIPNCDKIVPGMLMVAARLNMPSIFISGGPMLAGRIPGEADRELDTGMLFGLLGELAKGNITEERLRQVEEYCSPGCGSCSGMWTANTMNCMTEILGMGLPGNGTIPAVYSHRIHLAKQAGRAIIELVRKNVCARDIINDRSIRNAYTLDMALGGSTNSLMHMLAIAHEAGVEFPIAEVNEIRQRTPHLVKLAPASPHHIEDFYMAGGISALVKELGSLLNQDVLTVTGKTLKENVASAKNTGPEVIRSRSNPHSDTGGLTVLFGNLAPDGAVVKSGAVAPEMMVHRGPARVFDSEEEAAKALTAQDIKPGEVIIIRYEGPKGGPGMREMLDCTDLVKGLGLDKQVALVTDGRFSGATSGPAIGHVSPEAASRGPIATLRDGDMVNIDIPNCRLDVELEEVEVRNRLVALPEFTPRIAEGYLKRYAERVSSASWGAIVE